MKGTSEYCIQLQQLVEKGGAMVWLDSLDGQVNIAREKKIQNHLKVQVAKVGTR
jgi:hypothetical protein